MQAADVVISAPEQQRPDPKQLVPWSRTRPAVHVARMPDEWKEAEWSLSIVELHDDGNKWSDVAVLMSLGRLFFSLQQAFAEHIPVVPRLAGLCCPRCVEFSRTRVP